MKLIGLILSFLFLFNYKIECIENERLDIYTDVCYGDLGCFTNRPPFSTTLARPIAFTPESPEKVGAKFILYTRANPTTGSLITHDVENSVFRRSSETKILIHGFLDNGYNIWNVQVKDALLRQGDYNVIQVDWSKGNGFPYTQATANTQMVGALTARLVNSLVQRYGISAQSFHIIGHSLGGQTAGYAGERIPNLGRITGLDPAGPYFENTDRRVRLDDSDANFVDVIHTDGSANLQLGLGLMQRSGHVDFYLNGGKDQPNCPATSGKILSGIFNLVTINVDGLLDETICSHLVAVYYFRDSIENNECRYTAFPCSSKADFDAGKCTSCSVYGCNHVGLHASPRNDNGSLYLNTQSGRYYPYCEHHFTVDLYSNNLQGQNQARGKFSIILNGDRTNSLPFTLDDSDTTFKTGSKETRLVASSKYIGENIKTITVSYSKTTNFLSSFLYQDKWSFSYIDVKSGDNQNVFRFCSHATSYINSGQSVVYDRC